MLSSGDTILGVVDKLTNLQGNGENFDIAAYKRQLCSDLVPSTYKVLSHKNQECVPPSASFAGPFAPPDKGDISG